MKKILLLSAYHTDSHKSWAKGLMKYLPGFEWTLLALDPAFYPWRVRANALIWDTLDRETLSKPYDLILATSMVDLSTLCGLVPSLASTPKIVYFHENQLAYPLPEYTKNTENPGQFVNLYAAMCADKVVFNTKYNKQSFYDELKVLLKKSPDKTMVTCIKELEEKTITIPVGIEPDKFEKVGKIPNTLVWNHRWEYDKNPKDFFDACFALDKKGVDFQLIIMGREFNNRNEMFSDSYEGLKHRALCWGECSSEDYHKWLAKGHYVISTSIHEFQGMAVLEAASRGCVPIVPDRLSYPEIFSEEYRYGNTAEELIVFLEKELSENNLISPDVSGFEWSSLIGQYEDIF